MRNLRARRAAGIEPGAGTPLRDAGELLGPAVEETIAALQLGAEDAGVAALARRVAGSIDGAQSPVAALRALGPLFLKILVALDGRRARGKPAPDGLDWLGDMRKRRAMRHGSL